MPDGSTFVDMPTTGREFLSKRSAKTAERFGKRNRLPVFLINGRKHFRREDVIRALELCEIVSQPKPQPSSLKSMLEEISAKVLRKGRPS